MKKVILSSIIIAALMMVAFVAGNIVKDSISKQEVITVQLTKESARDIMDTKQIVIVPGDIVDEATPFDGSDVDCTGFASMNAIIHVQNISAETVDFRAFGYFKNVASVAEVEVVKYTRPVPPGESFHWTYTMPLYTNTFFVRYRVVGLGQVDVNHAVILSKANVPAP
jgi:hypothetical protein